MRPLFSSSSASPASPLRRPRKRRSLAVALLEITVVALLLCIAFVAPARADVFGRLSFSVKSAADEKPLPGAKITLHDSANVHPDVVLASDSSGNATSGLLEIRPWGIATEAENFNADSRQATPVADAVTSVEILLEPLEEKVIKIKGAKTLSSQPSNVAARNQNFTRDYPVSNGNPQSLSALTLTVPGFAKDSVNQSHPRGEHSATAIYINGFQLPGALQGRAGQVIVPEVIQSAQIMTGGYAPEYGSETAAVLNVNLKSGTIRPFQDFSLDGGSSTTFDGSLTVGGQSGAAYGPPMEEGGSARRLGYLVSLNSRSSFDALEPPQPDDQTARNYGHSADYFGNFDYALGSNDKLSLTLNSSPAQTQIANRSGLPASFTPYGQGYGYSGSRDANGEIPGADPTALGGGTILLGSQQADGQDINQKDQNSFSLLSLRHSFNDRLTGLVSYGLTNSQMDLTNHNPSVNLNALPVDSSIEFNPTMSRHANNGEFDGNLTLSAPHHTYKAGLLLDNQTGNESYQFIPASQLALDALAAVDSRLAPAGSTLMDSSGNPVLDALGNPVYQIAANATSPTLSVHRSGYYRAAYLQDTWIVNRRLTANYGLRFDWYKQDENLGQAGVSKNQTSPRVNLAYSVTPKTIWRLSYDRLFIQPPITQGAIIGEPIQPETYGQYESSIERQVAPDQTAKLAYYYKDIKNQIDTGILIPGTQIGAYSSVNLEKGGVHGLEFSYDLTPRGNSGVGAYVAYAYSIARPNGVDNTGAQVPTYNDHDQRHTLSSGLNYNFKSGALAALDVYYGSGVASSALADDHRTPNALVNLRLLAPRTTGKNHSWIQLGLEADNLFDSRKVINYASGFSGTRFTQARTLMLTATGSL